MKLPKTLQIGGFTYEVKYDNQTSQLLDEHNALGECSPSKQVIRVAMSTGSHPEQVEATFWHEVLHAIDHVYNKGKLDEADVRSLANGVFQVVTQLKLKINEVANGKVAKTR